MKNKLWHFSLVLIPTVALVVPFMVLPYFTFGLQPKNTTIYIFLGITIFLFLLRLKGSWTNEYFDKFITIIIWLIAIPIFLVFGTISIPIIIIFPFTTYIVIYFLAILVLFTFGIKLEKPINLPKGQFIVISNHCSTIDDIINPPIMGFKEWKVVFAPEIIRIPFVRIIAKQIGIPLIRTDKESKEEAKEELDQKIKEGYNILIFPEGQRLRVDEKENYLSSFKKGAFYLSMKNKIPIIPVVVSWTFLFKPRSGQWWFSPRKITIDVLNPMMAKEDETVNDFKERIRDLMLFKLKKHVE